MGNIIKFDRAYESYGYLSTWWFSTMQSEGLYFNCVEQYVMWRKAKFFKDDVIAEYVLRNSDPASMKFIGKMIGNYDSKVWRIIEEDVMFEGCLIKFKQNTLLEQSLLNFDRDTKFVYCDRSDTKWGIGYKMDDSRSDDEENWRGQNLLGKVLSKVRVEIELGV